MSKKFLKKGTKVFRLYGQSNGEMRPGDIGTLAKDQKFPGKYELKEFPEYHDPLRFRQPKDFPEMTPKQAAELFMLVYDSNFEGVVKFYRKLKARK